MPSSSSLAETFVRAAHALLLAIAPTSFSPEPLPPSGPWLIPAGLGVALLLVAVLYRAGRFRTWSASRAGAMAASLAWIAVAAALGAALVYGPANAPLARGVPFVAVPLWGALGAGAWALARRLAPERALAAAGALAAVLVMGGVEIARGVVLLRSPSRVWWTALWLEPMHERAATELVRPWVRAHELDEARQVIDGCLALQPDGCACLDQRVRLTPGEGAVARARKTVERCPDFGAARATLAEALIASGDVPAAEEEVRLGLARGGPEGSLRYALAQAHDRSGRAAEALREAKLAASLGAGRDAALYAAALAITSGDLDAAEALLGPLVAADPADADARYDLALCAEKRGNAEAARQGYLAALNADPRHFAARYNAANLAWRLGARGEAEHHVEQLRAAFPDDPRGAQLAHTIAGVPPPR